MAPTHQFGGVTPTIHETTFIAPGAHVIGDVHIGAEAGIWFNCVIRGDVNAIRIGARSNIQDGTIVHVTSQRFSTTIGNGVLIGHLCLIHGCSIEDCSFVGMGSTVMDGCVLEEHGMLGAGSLLSPGKVIRKGQLWLGRPARFVRELSPAELEQNRDAVLRYAELAARYRRGA
jgi:carbonic anhydrase/acetyltransferase-like protein (isoleucine patch superfamily)